MELYLPVNLTKGPGTYELRDPGGPWTPNEQIFLIPAMTLHHMGGRGFITHRANLATEIEKFHCGQLTPGGF
jgi:hypothetical protein